jgi:pimeloyl-ACP methyl ester carboxylesterase
VRRLVLAAAACRLSPTGHQLLAEVARLVKAADPWRASALVARALAPRSVRYPAAALSWLADPLAAGNPADMLITNAAAVAFDAEPELHRVRAPTLVIGGSADPYHSQDLFGRTAAGIPGGRTVIFPGKGHLYAAASKAAANIALGSCSQDSPSQQSNARSRGHRTPVGGYAHWGRPLRGLACNKREIHRAAWE